MARQLTVLQVLPALESGGVERGTLELANGLVKAGHRSLVMSAGGQLVSRLESYGSKHFKYDIGKKSPLTFYQSSRLRKFLVEYSVDILHARSRMPAWVAYRAWKSLPQTKRPAFITTVHGFYSVKRYSSIMTRGERVIAVSDAARKYIKENYPTVDMSRVRVIERGIDDRVYPYDYRPSESWWQRWYQEYPYLLDKQVLLLPGRITRLKGHLDFVELISRLVKQSRNIYGLIVGAEDPSRVAYLREVQQKIRAMGLEGFITFTGNRLDLRDIIATSNIVLSLSRQPESFGRTVQESLSLGIPVVGYDHGGVSDLLSRAFPVGRVVAGNIVQLEQVVTSILDNPSKVLSYPFQSIQNMVDETLQVYHELVNE